MQTAGSSSDYTEDQDTSKLLPGRRNRSWWDRRSIVVRILLIFLLMGTIGFAVAVVFLTNKLFEHDNQFLERGNNASHNILPNKAFNMDKVFDNYPRNSLLDGLEFTEDYILRKARNKPRESHYKKYRKIHDHVSHLVKEPPTASELGSDLLADMDLTVNPCENFYKFACGGFVKRAKIKHPSVAFDQLNYVQTSLNHQLVQILSQPSIPNEPNTFQQVKNFYQSCINYDPSSQQNMRHIKNLMNSVGGWPVIEGSRWNESSFDWVDSAKQLKSSGVWLNAFVTVKINYDLKNSTRREIAISPGQLSTHIQNFMQGPTSRVLHEHFGLVMKIAVIYGADNKIVSNIMQQVFRFELSLAQAIATTMDRSQRTTISSLEKAFPLIPFRKYINAYLEPITRITENDVIQLSNSLFFNLLQDAFKQTPKSVVANYYMSLLAILTLEQALLDINYKFSVASSNTKQMDCITLASKLHPIGISALYIKNYFNDNIKHKIVNMTDGIREEFKKMVRNVDWMDSKTKNYALEKTSAMTSMIAYPAKITNMQIVDNYTKDIIIKPESYIGNLINLKVFNLNQTIHSLRISAFKKSWFDFANLVVVNAFYNVVKNGMELPASILQGVFYNHISPNYINYGGIGSVIGHEITHGFDSNGRNFDKNGNLNQWWDKNAGIHFAEKSNCLIMQYSNYTVDSVKLKINGVQTLSENIADNGGIKIAYKAYKKYLKANGEEQQLPGLNYTNSQMYWISVGHLWCSNFPTDYLKNYILTDTHTAPEQRLLGAFANSQEFANDFNCPSGSRMNPRKKCTLW